MDEKNKKICELCKWIDFIEVKCAVCDNYNKFEPMIEHDDLLNAMQFVVKDTDNNISIYKAAILKWGHDVQLNMVIEECIELIIASLDYITDDMAVKEYTYADVIRSLSVYIKQLLKDARKNGYQLDMQPFDPSTMMDMFRSMFNSEMKKHMGKRRDSKNELIGELADVEIMIGQARHGMGLNDDIDKMKRMKLKRLQERLNQ